MTRAASTDTASSDESLLKAFFKGDDAALGELARRYETSLLGLACGLLHGRRDLARDAVQDTWMRVIRYGGGFKGKSSVRTWLYRITVNRCRDLLRDRRRREASDPSAPDRPSGSSPAPGDCDGSDETLRTAVENLPGPKREVILLCYHRALTHEQAAEILEIPLGTLKPRLHGALKELRERISEEVMA